MLSSQKPRWSKNRKRTRRPLSLTDNLTIKWPFGFSSYCSCQSELRVLSGILCITSFSAHSNPFLSSHLTFSLCLFSHETMWFLKVPLVGNLSAGCSSLKCLHLLGRTSMAECVEHGHYFNSLTPDQNNKDCCHQNYNMPGSVQWCVWRDKDPVFCWVFHC